MEPARRRGGASGPYRAFAGVTRRSVPLAADTILRCLADHAVDYLLIGGLAVQAHGHVRTTQDVDLLPAPGRANLDRLAAALAELNARPSGGGAVPPGGLDGAAIEGAGVLALDTDAGGVDVHTAPPGAASFAAMLQRALELEVAGTRVVVVGRDDLIAMKRAADRPLDRGDVIALTAPERPEE